MSNEEDLMADANLTSEQKYQRDYYQQNKEDRQSYAKDRWEHDLEYREREIQRAKDRRARERASKASSRFVQMIEERRAEADDTCNPLLTDVDGEQVLVYTSGSLSREVGRSARAIRMWLNDGTLPGATVFIQRRAYFSERFCNAVYRACEELFYLNGRGEKKILKRLIVKELAKEGITYVPTAHRGDNSVRTVAVAEGE